MTRRSGLVQIQLVQEGCSRIRLNIMVDYGMYEAEDMEGVFVQDFFDTQEIVACMKLDRSDDQSF